MKRSGSRPGKMSFGSFGYEGWGPGKELPLCAQGYDLAQPSFIEYPAVFPQPEHLSL
jgi:hypothetical protein